MIKLKPVRSKDLVKSKAKAIPNMPAYATVRSDLEQPTANALLILKVGPPCVHHSHTNTSLHHSHTHTNLHHSHTLTSVHHSHTHTSVHHSHTHTSVHHSHTHTSMHHSHTHTSLHHSHTHTNVHHSHTHTHLLLMTSSTLSEKFCWQA